ncbi:MAG TPA: hypothetical protein PJ994_12615, partial [Tepidiformaceae bacterium]|nr:hypothetical protein [Tepidiformaceae bacterium]
MSDLDREEFETRLQAVRLSLGSYESAVMILFRDGSSPFRSIVDWDINRTGTRAVKPASLEAGVRASFRLLGVDMDVDEALALFMAIWRGVRSAWGARDPQWGDPDRLQQVYGKAALVAVTEFMVDLIQHKLDDGQEAILEPAQVESFASRIFREIPEDFWITPWRPKGLDTSAGRALIKGAMRTARREKNMGNPNPLSSIEDFFADS